MIPRQSMQTIKKHARVVAQPCEPAVSQGSCPANVGLGNAFEFNGYSVADTRRLENRRYRRSESLRYGIALCDTAEMPPVTMR